MVFTRDFLLVWSTYFHYVELSYQSRASSWAFRLHIVEMSVDQRKSRVKPFIWKYSCDRDHEIDVGFQAQLVSLVVAWPTVYLMGAMITIFQWKIHMVTPSVIELWHVYLVLDDWGTVWPCDRISFTPFSLGSRLFGGLQPRYPSTSRAPNNRDQWKNGALLFAHTQNTNMRAKLSVRRWVFLFYSRPRHVYSLTFVFCVGGAKNNGRAIKWLWTEPA